MFDEDDGAGLLDDALLYSIGADSITEPDC